MIVVVFPAPLPPNNATTCPAETENETVSTAQIPPKRFVSARTLMTAVGPSLPHGSCLSTGLTLFAEKTVDVVALEQANA